MGQPPNNFTLHVPPFIHTTWESSLADCLSGQERERERSQHDIDIISWRKAEEKRRGKGYALEVKTIAKIVLWSNGGKSDHNYEVGG